MMTEQFGKEGSRGPLLGFCCKYNNTCKLMNLFRISVVLHGKNVSWLQSTKDDSLVMFVAVTERCNNGDDPLLRLNYTWPSDKLLAFLNLLKDQCGSIKYGMMHDSIKIELN